jgi:hypothetical protein
MPDIDEEDVVDAFAPSEENAARTRAVGVSLAFREWYTLQNDYEDDLQQHKRKRCQIERNRDARQWRLFQRLAAVSFFRPERDATGRLGYSAEQKEAAALPVSGYAEVLDQPDYFLRMSEESILQSFLRST